MTCPPRPEYPNPPMSTPLAAALTAHEAAGAFLGRRSSLQRLVVFGQTTAPGAQRTETLDRCEGYWNNSARKMCSYIGRLQLRFVPIIQLRSCPCDPSTDFAWLGPRDRSAVGLLCSGVLTRFGEEKRSRKNVYDPFRVRYYDQKPLMRREKREGDHMRRRRGTGRYCSTAAAPVCSCGRWCVLNAGPLNINCPLNRWVLRWNLRYIQ
jgi:hypothetical protein